MIGLGHMGRAILEGVLRQALVPSSQVYLSDLDLAKTKPLQDTYGCLSLRIRKLRRRRMC